MGVLDRDPGGGPESRLWAAVVERGQEPERLDQTEKGRPRLGWIVWEKRKP
jgi:hypothetical protein